MIYFFVPRQIIDHVIEFPRKTQRQTKKERMAIIQG